MKLLEKNCRIALVQGTPVLFDRKATIDKVVEQIREAGKKGAQLIVFPESYVPCYPYGMTFGFTVGSRTAEGRIDWKRYYDNSVLVPSEDTQRVGQAAKEVGAYVSLGITERDGRTCTLYCTNLIFSPEGELVAHHRKLKPTGAERCVWGDGNKGAFPVVDSPWGVMGSLICWENYMPLARAALYQKGVSLYLAPNTNNNSEWQDTIRHIAIEGHCYFINADLIFRREDYPQTVSGTAEIAALPDIACRGGSCVIDPFGHEASVTVWDKEAVIYADLNMQKVPASRMELDCVGHYARPDVLELRVNEK